MKIVIVSDVHGNDDVLPFLPQDYDELWVLGDLVNYGPAPAQTVAWAMRHAAIAIRGNHDDAVARADDSRWSARFRATAEATRRHSEASLDAAQMAFLRSLPRDVALERDGVRFRLVHATLADPLYGRRAADSPDWAEEITGCDADVLLVGHSHVPTLRRFGARTLLNPGSLGQPRDGRTKASYAVWENGAFALRSFDAPVETTVAKIKAIGYAPAVEDELVAILRTGRA